MSIEQLFKIEELIFKAAMKEFSLARYDMKIISVCLDTRQSLYTLGAYGLDRGLTAKRLKIMEDKGYITRKKIGKSKIITLTEKSLEVVKFIESIKI